MKSKKGDIWISAVLYFGLGIIVITILLTAGLPVINKLRDKNIAIQTKNAFQVLDTNVREVLKGGPGTQRVVTLELKRVEFSIDETNELVKWEFDSKAFLTEPSACTAPETINEIWVSEGNVNVCTEKASTKGSYKIIMILDYSDVSDISGDIAAISGLGDISIRNDGVQQNTPEDPCTGLGSPPACKIKISITQI